MIKVVFVKCLGKAFKGAKSVSGPWRTIVLCLGRRERASQSHVQQMKETLVAQTQLSAGLSTKGLIFSVGLGRMCGYCGMNTSSLLFCDFFFFVIFIEYLKSLYYVPWSQVSFNVQISSPIKHAYMGIASGYSSI